MSEELTPGHTVLAIRNDDRRFWSWPVNYELAWEQATVVDQGDKEDYWVLSFEDDTRVTRHREAFMRIDFHVDALGDRGQLLMDTGMFSGMGMYASSKTLDGAEEIARNFFRDPRVHACGISTYIQETQDSSWKWHRFLKTIQKTTQER